MPVAMLAGLATATLFLCAACGTERQPEGFYSRRVDVLNPATQTWSSVRKLPFGIIRGRATSMGGVIYLAGGESRPARSIPFLSYNAATNVWTRLPAPPGTSALLWHELVALGTDVLLITGPALYVYDTNTGTWATGPPPQTSHSPERFGAVAFAGRLVVVEVSPGGSESFDPTTGLWTGFPSVPGGSWVTTAATDGNRIFAAEGVQLWGYDPVTGSWTTAPPPPWPQGFEPVSAAAGQDLYFVGKTGGFVYAFDPAAQTWSSPPTRSPALPWPTAGSTGGLLYVMGGKGHRGVR